MAGAAQRDRAARDASGGPSGPRLTPGLGQFGAIQAAAPSLGVEVSPSTCAMRARSSAPSRHSRSSLEWRPDRDGERVRRRFIAI